MQPTLAEEEVVRGFNMMSPYQDNAPAGVPERRAYMDRCAELGMKVHYHLLAAAGGGGVTMPGASEPLDREQALRAEVEAFRDHPALLAWYICDEPTGHGATPEELARIYRVVREVDPYHPVSIVFMAPDRAREYAECMDVVMTDPYVIPNGPPGAVRWGIQGLVGEFDAAKAVWLVPQAFGGNEFWTREPTAREQRVMTYLGIVHGSTGIQYFIRHGLNGFPKSTSMWAECGRMALEVAELTPALLSHEARPGITCPAQGVEVAAWRDRGVVIAVAVNTENAPRPARLEFEDLGFSGEAEVLFENRHVAVSGGVIQDVLDPFGTRVYQIAAGPTRPERVEVHPRNLIVNPSFEHNPSPGTPAGCYADVGTGRGATYFVDSRTARHGRHSVRLIAPTDQEGMLLSPYAPRVTPRKSYRLSVWAKALPGETTPVLRLAASGLGEASFPLTAEWHECELRGRVEAGIGRLWVSVGLISPGTAWLDLLQLAAVSPVIRPDSGIFVGSTKVRVETYEHGASLRVTLDGADPTGESSPYTGPITVTDTTTVKAAAFREGVLVGDVVEATYTRVECRAPEAVGGLEPGVAYSYYEGMWSELPDFSALEPAGEGVAAGFDISQRQEEDGFAFVFRGYIEVARDGIYTFATLSDDGSKLYIGEQAVVQNDGLHGAAERSGAIALKAGLHPITVTFFERDGGENLGVYYEGPDLPRQRVPGDVLWHEGP